jgi:hypothetical protein
MTSFMQISVAAGWDPRNPVQIAQRIHPQYLRMIFGALLLWIVVVRAFPESANPITEEPPLVRPNTAQTKVVIFENAACSSWNLVLSSEYSPPDTKKWSKVILDFSVSHS